MNFFAFKKKRKNIIIFFVCLFSFLSVCAVCFLPFATVTQLPSDSAYYHGNENSKNISLMFNVYQGTEEVQEIMRILKEYGAKATFFVGGSWADDHPDILKEILREGHEIGNHGYFHKDSDKLSASELETEISACDRYVLLVTGKKMNLFAPPSGAYDERTVSVCQKMGYSVIMWSKDTIDWRDQDTQKIFTRATDKACGGDLILMHPTKCTVSALPKILEFYKNNGFFCVSVTENITG